MDLAPSRGCGARGLALSRGCGAGGLAPSRGCGASGPARKRCSGARGCGPKGPFLSRGNGTRGLAPGMGCGARGSELSRGCEGPRMEEGPKGGVVKEVRIEVASRRRTSDSWKNQEIKKPSSKSRRQSCTCGDRAGASNWDMSKDISRCCGIEEEKALETSSSYWK